MFYHKLLALTVYYLQALSVHHLMLSVTLQSKNPPPLLHIKRMRPREGERPAEGCAPGAWPTQSGNQVCNHSLSSFHSAKLCVKNLNDFGQIRITPKGARAVCHPETRQWAEKDEAVHPLSPLARALIEALHFIDSGALPGSWGKGAVGDRKVSLADDSVKAWFHILSPSQTVPIRRRSSKSLKPFSPASSSSSAEGRWDRREDRVIERSLSPPPRMSSCSECLTSHPLACFLISTPPHPRSSPHRERHIHVRSHTHTQICCSSQVCCIDEKPEPKQTQFTHPWGVSRTFGS